MRFQRLLILAWLVAGAGCATPAEHFTRQAVKRGFTADVVSGSRFSHFVLRHGGAAADILHIYIDGDGSPMLAGVPSPDPTPRNTLVLDLMALDPAPSAYVGRPCYHGIRGPECRGALWTSARYSEAVVDSLVVAVRNVVAAAGARRVVWIGHSGGGALARLAAPRLQDTAALITVGANLALRPWAALHDVAVLEESLDPALAPPLPRSVYQRHYVGSQDRVAPPAVVTLGAMPAPVVVVTGFGHVCCWAERWPSVLAELAAGLAAMSEH